jgi:glycosyltransferase involved in cell wall biosynthesis
MEINNKIKILYLLPERGSQGGMTAITSMYYKIGLFENPNIKHFNTSFKSSSKLFRLFESFSIKVKYIITLMKFRPDAIYVMTSSSWGFYDKCFYALIARWFSIRSIVNPVGGAFSHYYENYKIHKVLIEYFIKIPNMLVVGSTYWFNYYNRNFPQLKLSQILNPVDVSAFSEKGKKNSTNNIFRIVTVSNIIKSKGICELIELIDSMAGKYKFIQFVIIGDGELRPVIMKKLKHVIESKQLIVTGFISEDEKKAWLCKSNLFILLSHFEVIPISILEAMSASLPVVATDTGGIPDIVKSQTNGELVEIKNVEESIMAVEKFINMDAEEINSYCENSYEIVSGNYDIKTVVKKQIEILTSLVDN